MRSLLGAAFGAGVTGILLVLALPPVGWWPLGWIALVPLFLACTGRRFLVAFLLGLVATGTTALISSSGLLYADHDRSGESTWITLGCTLFGFVLALVAAVFSEVRPERRLALPALAAFGVFLELGLLKILPVTFALTQAPLPTMRLLASITGIWGVAFVLWWGNLWIAAAIARRQGPPQYALAGFFAFILLGYVWAALGSSERSVPVVLVQTESTELEHLAKLSGTDEKSLAVWPEFAGLAAAPAGQTEQLKRITKGAAAVVTSFRDDYRPMPHNVAALFSEGKESKRYAKQMLFGGERNMHTPGTESVSVPWAGTEVGLSICFDSCGPGLFRRTANEGGVHLIALPTIDPPSPYHWMAAMHAAFIPFRGAETGIPIVRVDGFAYSEAVDGKGNALATLPPGERTLKAQVPLQRRWTLYRTLGDWFLIVCGALIALALLPRRKSSSPEFPSKRPRLPA